MDARKSHLARSPPPSAVVELGGERVLVDPLGRRRHRGIEGYSAVLITHSHVDHLNRWTLKRLDKSARLIVPKGAKPIGRRPRFSDVSEAEPGDQIPIGGLEVTCVPTVHDNGRWRKGDAPICTGYVLARDGRAVLHAGDVDMSERLSVFDDIGKRFEIDVAMLPIGGMLPVWYYRWRRRASTAASTSIPTPLSRCSSASAPARWSRSTGAPSISGSGPRACLAVDWSRWRPRRGR